MGVVDSSIIAIDPSMDVISALTIVETRFLPSSFMGGYVIIVPFLATLFSQIDGIGGSYKGISCRSCVAVYGRCMGWSGVLGLVMP